MSKKGNKAREKVFETMLNLNNKIDDSFSGIMGSIENLSDEDKIRLKESGILNDLGNSMGKLDESMSKLQEKIKKKNG